MHAQTQLQLTTVPSVHLLIVHSFVYLFVYLSCLFYIDMYVNPLICMKTAKGSVYDIHLAGYPALPLVLPISSDSATTLGPFVPQVTRRRH